jgi:parvulin-like peptidyl-prolyl isomerase
MKNLTAVAIAVTALCVIVLAQEEQPAASGSEVVLRINGEEITRAEFEAALIRDKSRRFMEELIDLILLQQAAKKAGVAVTDEKLEEWLEFLLLQELAKYGNDLEKLKDGLKLRGYTFKEYKAVIAREARPKLLVEKLITKERITEENMRKLFEQRYPKDAGRIARAYQILISTNKMHDGILSRLSYLKYRFQVASAKQKEKISTEIAQLKEKLEEWKKLNSRKVADKVVKKLREGADFAEIAKKYGAGYTAESFDMGWVARQWLFRLLVPVIFEQLKPGEVAEPVQSRYGFHIVKLIDIKDVSELKYEEVRPYMLDELSTRVVSKHEIEHFMLHLREKAAIERPDLPLEKKRGGEPGK